MSDNRIVGRESVEYGRAFQDDEGNARKNEHHGVSMAEAEQVFFNAPLLVLSDAKHNDTEPRFHALGKTIEGRRLHITFALRDADQPTQRGIWTGKERSPLYFQI